MTYLKTLFIGLFLLSTVIVFGQAKQFEFGIEGSPSQISLRGNEIIDNKHKSKLGFSGGVFFQFNYNKFLSLRTNLAYERKGSKTEAWTSDVNNDDEYESEGTIHANFNYLTLPILIRATLGNKVKYFVNVGPYAGYLMKKTTVHELEDNFNVTYDETSLFKRFDAGITTGIGFSVPIKAQYSLSFEVRNNLGLINTSSVPVMNDGTIKTNSTNFLFGFTYNIGQ